MSSVVKRTVPPLSARAVGVYVSTHWPVLAVLFAVGTSLAGCGYGFVEGGAPFGGRELAVLTFAEYEPLGIAPDLQRYLSELAEHEGARLVSQSSNADGVIRGLIRQGTTTALPISDPLATISAYQISVQIDAQMTDRSGKVVWASTLTVSEDFLPGAGQPSQATLGTEASRRRALDRLAQKSAREIYDRIVMTSAMGIEAAPLVAGRNVPRLSPWAPLPPLTAAGAPIYGPRGGTTTSEPPAAPATYAPTAAPVTPATPTAGAGVETDTPTPRLPRTADPADEEDKLDREASDAGTQ